jgi:plasmid stabilization system protein ParE
MIRFSPDAVMDVERLRGFLSHKDHEAAQRALARIWTAIERLQEFPALGMRTGDSDVRQIVVRFGASAYIVRYISIAGTNDLLVTRVWHGREARI